MDLEKYGIKWPRLTKLRAEIRDLEHQKAQAEQAVANARNAIPAAQLRDAEDDAKSIRAGKSGSRAQHAAKARAGLEDSERDLAAYTKAVESVQADLNTFIAQHNDALLEAMAEALNKSDQELAYHARQAARPFAFREDARYDLKAFEPAPPLPDENAPAQKLSNTLIYATTQRAAGPARGDVEGMLAYLASFAAPENKESSAA